MAYFSMSERGGSSGHYRGAGLSAEEIVHVDKVVRQLYQKIRRDDASDAEKDAFKQLIHKFQSDSHYCSSLSSFASDVRLHDSYERSQNRKELFTSALLGYGFSMPFLSNFFNGLISAGSAVSGVVDDVDYNLGEDAVPLAVDAAAVDVGNDIVGKKVTPVPNVINQADKIVDSSSKGFDWSKLSSLLGLGFDGLSASLVGIGSQIGSSILNYQNQVKLIDKQNEYNTPANQMARFAEAGLNPNLIYGMGSNGNQPASGSIAPVDFDTSQRENRLARMQIGTQLAMAKADVAEKMSNVRLRDAQGDQVAQQSALTKLQVETYMQNFVNEQNLMIAQYEKLIEEKREAMANADSAEARAMYANDISRYEMQIREAQAKTEKIVSDWAQVRQATGAFGDVAHIGLGVNASFGRSNSISHSFINK